MYAVIQTGGKQVRVAEGDVVRIERTSSQTLAKGDEVLLTDILALGKEDAVRLGTPLIEGASVKAVVVRELRAPKVLVYKKKRRKGYQKFHGHRQNLLEVRVQAIQGH